MEINKRLNLFEKLFVLFMILHFLLNYIFWDYIWGLLPIVLGVAAFITIFIISIKRYMTNRNGLTAFLLMSGTFFYIFLCILLFMKNLVGVGSV